MLDFQSVEETQFLTSDPRQLAGKGRIPSAVVKAKRKGKPQSATELHNLAP
jgi:hypothetical protein